MSDEILRAFIAVALPPETRSALGRVITDLVKVPAKVKWVRPDSIHLTIKFLGEVERNVLPRLEAALKEPLSQIAPFEVNVKGIGGFPNLKRPRVIWVGVEDPAEGLQKVFKLVEENLLGEGFEPEERPFQGHLTLGRVKEISGLEALTARMTRHENFTGGVVKVDALHLYRSELKPQGAVYSVLQTYPLGK